MTDLNSAAQQAIFDRLSHASITATAPIHQHVPDNAQPPFHVVGDMTAEPVGSKDSGFDQITFDIITLIRKPSRKALFAEMAKVRDRLEGATLTATGVLLSAPVFETADDDLLDDGQTYAGTQRFSLYAQPA